MTDPLRLSFTVACPPDHAFSTWAENTSLWWPPSHTVTAEPGLTVTFEPRPGGRIFERTPAGIEEDWGEVLAWEPPERLVYLWHLRQDRADATEVEITFGDGGDGTTRVEVEHRGWERLGDRAADGRRRNTRGWEGLLPLYIAACA